MTALVLPGVTASPDRLSAGAPADLASAAGPANFSSAAGPDGPPPAAGPVDLAPTEEPVEPPLLVGLGDSVTFGVGDSPGSTGWTGHLAGLLGTRAANLGCNGARARDVLAEQLPAALRLRPALAAIFVGGNDVLRGDFDVHEVERALTATVRALLDAGTQVALVIPPSIGPELPGPQALRRVLGRRMEQVRQVVRRLAQQLPPESVVLDAQLVRDRGGVEVFHIDRIHPSPLGHRVLASLVADELAARGRPITGRLGEIPDPPNLSMRIAWLVMKGVPWLVRRSRDLLPELVRIVVVEERARRRAAGRP